MKRRDLLRSTGVLLSAAPFLGARRAWAVAEAPPLRPPAEGSINVAFVLSQNAVVIDFTGPWEVFQDATVAGRADAPFNLYTVAESTAPIRASAGLKIVPDYSFAEAPAPRVVVIPAQRGGAAAEEWIRNAARTADVVMSVCTGPFLLARTGLLAGKRATTHHDSYKMFALTFPDVRLQRGARFVDEGGLATAGGLSSGIDLALHVVERYFGREAARATGHYMEYQGEGWLDPNSNAAYAVARVSTDEHPLCPLCDMDVDKATAPRSVYRGKTYYFCSDEHKKAFDATPERYLEAGQ